MDSCKRQQGQKKYYLWSVKMRSRSISSGCALWSSNWIEFVLKTFQCLNLIKLNIFIKWFLNEMKNEEAPSVKNVFNGWLNLCKCFSSKTLSLPLYYINFVLTYRIKIFSPLVVSALYQYESMNIFYFSNSLNEKENDPFSWKKFLKKLPHKCESIIEQR